MYSKVFTILSMLFVAQTVSSCCECEEVFNYNVRYTSLSLVELDTSKLTYSVAPDTVFKNSFGLELTVDTEMQIAKKLPLNFGFTNAMACSCPDNEFNIISHVSQMNVRIINEKTGEKDEANSLFKVAWYTGDDSFISIAEYLEIRPDFRRDDLIYLQLIDFEDMPSLASFEVDVILTSEKVITQQSRSIVFI